MQIKNYDIKRQNDKNSALTNNFQIRPCPTTSGLPKLENDVQQAQCTQLVSISPTFTIIFLVQKYKYLQHFSTK